MPTKVFTTLGGKCPYKKCDFDSQTCRTCQYFYRTGTATFFWCNHPIEQDSAGIVQNPRKIAQKAPEIEQPKRKRGRPPGKATKKPVKRKKIKKR